MVSMDLTDASDQTMAKTFESLIQMQHYSEALEIDTDDELDPLKSELANFHAELQGKVRARGLDEQEIARREQEEYRRKSRDIRNRRQPASRKKGCKGQIW